MFSQTGQYNCLATAFTSLSVGVGLCAWTRVKNNPASKSPAKSAMSMSVMCFFNVRSINTIRSKLISALNTGRSHFPIHCRHPNRFMFFFRPGSHQRAKDEYKTTQPQPIDQRIVVHLEGHPGRGNGFPVHQQDV